MRDKDNKAEKTDNAMAKKQKTKIQTTVYKTKY